MSFPPLVGPPCRMQEMVFPSLLAVSAVIVVWLEAASAAPLPNCHQQPLESKWITSQFVAP